MLSTQSLSLILMAYLFLPMQNVFGAQPHMIPNTPEQSRGSAAYQTIVDSILAEELIFRTEYRNQSLKDAIPGNELNGLETAWFLAVTKYVSENPALFGGDPSRGFDPKIWKSMIKVFRERSIPMTSDGILLPPRNGFEIRALGIGQKSKSGAIVGIRLFLVDKAGQLIGPNMQPLTRTAFTTLDEDTANFGGEMDEFFFYANIQKELFNNNGIQIRGLVLDASNLESADPQSTNFVKCFSLIAGGEFSEASSCFGTAGSQLLRGGADLAIDLGTSGGRGALAGAAVGGGLTPSMTSATGAGLGALGNMLGVIYNAFFKKEVVTTENIRNLMGVFSQYSFTVNAYGEILPSKGQWAITKNGYIRRVTNFGGRYVLLNVLGQPITTSQGISLSKEAFPPIGSFNSSNQAP